MSGDKRIISNHLVLCLALAAMVLPLRGQSGSGTTFIGMDVGTCTLPEAATLKSRNDFLAAEVSATECLRRGLRTADAHRMLGYSYLRQGKPKEALAEYTSFAKLEAPSAEDLRHVALAYVVLDDMSDAEKWLNVAIEMDAADADSWYDLGRIRYTQNRFADAEEIYRKALSLSPRSVKIMNNLGLCYEALGDTEHAASSFRIAIAWQQQQAPPLSELPLLNLADLLIHQNQLEESRELLLKARVINGASAPVHARLGHLYLISSRFREAQEEFKQALAITPDDAPVHFQLGQAYRKAGATQQAALEFHQAAKLTGTHSNSSF